MPCKPHIEEKFFVSYSYTACCSGVKLMLIGGVNSFEKTIRKKNGYLGQKGAKMLKNQPKRGEKNPIYIVETKICRIFARPKNGKRDVPYGNTRINV